MVFEKLGWMKNLLSPDKLLSGCFYQCYRFKIEGDKNWILCMKGCFLVMLVWFGFYIAQRNNVIPTLQN